jgi:ubiquinone/menaquinone biosynthesis C-methylase UbiE
MDKIIEYYDELASTYDENRFENQYGKFIDAQERRILKKLLANPDEIVLDLACGSGRLLNFATIGTDGSIKMIEIAKSKFPKKSVHLNDAAKMHFESNAIDTIFSFHFFMHLDQEKIDEILKECHRVLKENGRLIFDFPSQKRSKFLKYKTSEWHGAYSTTLNQLKRNPYFTISSVQGLLFLPIHRFPKVLRRFFVKLDLLLANSFLKEYSSYLVVELHKK